MAQANETERPSVLYAEDDPIIKDFYSKFFKLQGYEQIYAACDGEVAWETYLQHKPDILILDIDMPKLDGLSLAKRIRKDDLQTRIIIATAYIDNEKLMLATELHLTRYLPKPFSTQLLFETIDKAIQERNHLNIVVLEDDYNWNPISKLLLHNGMAVKLTRQERQLLEILGSKPSHVFATDYIMSTLWEYDMGQEITNDKLKALVRRLRKKLPADAIENIYGVGYRLNIS